MVLGTCSEFGELVEKLNATISDRKTKRSIYTKTNLWFNDMEARCLPNEACMTQAYKEYIDVVRSEHGLPARVW